MNFIIACNKKKRSFSWNTVRSFSFLMIKLWENAVYKLHTSNLAHKIVFISVFISIPPLRL